MAKTLRDTPITVADIQEYLATRDDFDLEMHVYRTAKALGFTTTHGGTYEDPITEKPRQFDVRAIIERTPHHRIALAIECKALAAFHPLVISRLPRSRDESFHHVILARERRKVKQGTFQPAIDMNIYGRSKSLSIGPDRSMYPPGKMVGKSTAQVGRTTNDELVGSDNDVWDKWSQALASAADLVYDSRSAHERHGLPDFLSVVIPALVVSDGTLWVADYSEDGVLQGDPVQTNETTLFVDRGYGDTFNDTITLTHLHVYTRTGMDAFLQSISATPGIWGDVFPRDAIGLAIAHLDD